MAVRKEITAIINLIKKDSGYRESWKANIAMAFYDEFRRTPSSKRTNLKAIHKIANKAADNFVAWGFVNKFL